MSPLVDWLADGADRHPAALALLEVRVDRHARVAAHRDFWQRVAGTPPRRHCEEAKPTRQSSAIL
ncbi:hypothetical protein [Candidatus Accumulibacter sp. ACC003]|uniref:hypothetical protein n=1 Tax=Candidatus Accumulibacter sp. ACC003 TaxID=2823334 RepID=UPI0025BA2C68|nr:hypothetical protein [Candidatus Accumulibacter sp. ACC003]